MEPDLYFSDLFSLLESEICQAKKEIFLAAPYIKIGLLDKLTFPTDIAHKTTVVCRWNLNDILSGSTDVEIFPWLRDKGIKVLLHQNLHAKYYRCDSRILMGSANLTLNGLISNDSGNLELLSANNISASSVAFEKKIVEESIVINDEIYLEYSEIVPVHNIKNEAYQFDYFWPEFETFEAIWAIYNLNHFDGKLQKLCIPSGLDRKRLKSFLKIRLKEFTNIREIEKFLASQEDGRRFGEVRSFIRDLDEAVNETSAWQNLMALLLDLFPERYEYFRPNHTEIIISKRV